jgi:hypothetical protein
MWKARPKEAVPPNLLAGDGTLEQPDPEVSAAWRTLEGYPQKEKISKLRTRFLFYHINSQKLVLGLRTFVYIKLNA